MFCISANGICTGICLIKVSSPQRCQLQQQRLVRLQTAPEWIFPINSIGLGKCQSLEERLKTSVYTLSLISQNTKLCIRLGTDFYYVMLLCIPIPMISSLCLRCLSSECICLSDRQLLWDRVMNQLLPACLGSQRACLLP